MFRGCAGLAHVPAGGPCVAASYRRTRSCFTAHPQHAPSPPPGALEHHVRPLPLSRRATPAGQAAGGPCRPLVGRRSFTGSEHVPSVALALTLDQEQREGRRTAASPSRPRRARPRRRRSSPRRRRAPPPPPWRGALLAVSRPATAAGLAGACAASMRHRRTMRGADGALPRRPTARDLAATLLYHFFRCGQTVQAHAGSFMGYRAWRRAHPGRAARAARAGRPAAARRRPPGARARAEISAQQCCRGTSARRTRPARRPGRARMSLARPASPETPQQGVRGHFDCITSTLVGLPLT